MSKTLEDNIVDELIKVIRDFDEASTFIKSEIYSAYQGSFEANYFARKSKIEIEADIVKEIPLSKDSPQMVLTNLLMEHCSTRSALSMRLSVIDRIMQLYRIGKYEESDSKQYIKNICDRRDIRHLIHFTKLENIPGILNIGILSKEYMDEIGLKYVFNDNLRLDGMYNSISLSISFPNYKMFYKYRMRELDKEWAVILISPSILWEEDCLFCKYNAADRRIRGIAENLGTPDELEGMFNREIESEMSNLKSSYTSDPQAEVLVYNNISPRKIEKIIVQNNRAYELVNKITNHKFNQKFEIEGSYFKARMHK